ncbi:MAG TPA: helix-turn-helix domain-containing protein [Pirellulaceae bacterium]|nr:helix-turn-helix domain-containing protein [Pirellulaceae bacterium]
MQRVLADCKGNISEAARRLDIPRRTLQRKLKKMAP